jgi:hypothetical protein
MEILLVASFALAIFGGALLVIFGLARYLVSQKHITDPTTPKHTIFHPTDQAKKYYAWHYIMRM